MLQLWAVSALRSALDFLAVTEMDALSHLFGSGNTAWEPRDGAGLHRDGHLVYSLLSLVFYQENSRGESIKWSGGCAAWCPVRWEQVPRQPAPVAGQLSLPMTAGRAGWQQEKS